MKRHAAGMRKRWLWYRIKLAVRLSWAALRGRTVVVEVSDIHGSKRMVGIPDEYPNGGVP